MALPAAPTPDQHDRISEELKDLPGAQFLRPHYLDGPYRIVMVKEAPDPNWQADAIMRAFPAVRAPYQSLWDANTIDYADLYLLPELLADMLVWHESEYKLDLEHEILDLDSWDTWLGEEQWVNVLADLISGDVTDTPTLRRYRAAIGTLGAERYCALAAAIEPQHPDAEAFDAVIQAAVQP